MARDRVMATLRRGTRRAERLGRSAGAEAYGITRKVTHRGGEEQLPPNDAALVQEVETRLFRDPNVPKGRININAEEGVIVLRGEPDRPK